MMAVDKPNYTQVPNLILDDLLPLMESSELRVTLAIARATFGYHRPRAELTVDVLMTKTGLSRGGVMAGLAAGIARGIIIRENEGRRRGVYGLVIDGESSLLNRPDGDRGQANLVYSIDQSGPSSLLNRPDASADGESSLLSRLDGEARRPDLVQSIDQLGESSLLNRPNLVHSVDQAGDPGLLNRPPVVYSVDRHSLAQRKKEIRDLSIKAGDDGEIWAGRPDDHPASPAAWARIVDEVGAQLLPQQRGWLAGSSCRELPARDGMPQFEISIAHPEHLEWIRDRLGRAFARAIGISARRVVNVIIIASVQEEIPCQNTVSSHAPGTASPKLPSA